MLIPSPAFANAPVIPGFERHGKVDAHAGHLLLTELNCVACHQPTSAVSLPKQAPVLDSVGTRLRPAFYRAFLADPQKVKPGTSMPGLFHSAPDAAAKIEALAHFLVSTGTAAPETWDPKLAAKGQEAYHRIGCVACHGTRDEKGRPAITTSSTVPLGNLAGKYTLPGLASFLATPHAARPSGRMPALFLAANEQQRVKDAASVAHYLAQPAPGESPSDLEAKVDPKLVEQGRKLFASEGCASCHSIKDLKPSAASAPELAKLKPDGGCMSDPPRQGVPSYSLSTGQKSALAVALKSPTAAAKTPAEVIAQTLTTFNCYACHSRDKVGGPEEALDKAFLTLQPEMGDEARIPPFLDRVGAKIRTEYLKSIFQKGSTDRPYMVTRMPAFGEHNLDGLITALQEADKDRVPPLAHEERIDSESRAKGQGRHLVGPKAFSCYKCHTFAGQKAEGTQGIDMTLFTTRLQKAWFYAYLDDPQKFRPGTRMPSPFDKGKSLLPKVLDGTALTQTEAIWRYLSDGKNAQVPEGFGSKVMLLAPQKEAIVYRSFIKGAGARAIGVGYPEHVNLAFDANDLRLALIWQGAFIDAAKQWEGRGGGLEPPHGDQVVAFPSGPALARLAQPSEPWPKASAKQLGMKFTGYQLTPDQRPTFLYSFGEISVADFPNAATDPKMSLTRTLKFSAPGPADNLYFRAAVGKKIEALGVGTYRIDGAIRMRISAGPSLVINREAGTLRELLVPVPLQNARAEITQEIAWE